MKTLEYPTAEYWNSCMESSSQPVKTGFQQHMHVFRGVAIILIVVAHTLPSLDWTESPLILRFFDGIFNQASILFCFIAGYLFQYLSVNFSYKIYLLQKFKTVLLPYLLVSIPALYIFTQLVPRTGMFSSFYELEVWQQVVIFIITGKHLAPLWFVPTIALFYILAPLFLWVDRRGPKLYWLIVPLVALSTYLGRGGQLGPLNFAIYLLPVYLLGMAFSKFKDQADGVCWRWRLPLIGLMVIFVGAHIIDLPSPPHWHLPAKVLMALLMVVYLRRYHRLVGSRLDYIADASFGIFFVHSYFISAVKVLTVYLVSKEVYVGVGEGVIRGGFGPLFLYASFVLLSSIAIIWVARKVIGKNSRMIVGA